MNKDDWCSKSPDTVLGLPFWKACKVHDYCYAEDTKYTRLEADLIFLKKLFRISEEYGVNFLHQWVGYFFAAIYFISVRLFGTNHYEGHVRSDRRNQCYRSNHTVTSWIFAQCGIDTQRKTNLLFPFAGHKFHYINDQGDSICGNVTEINGVTITLTSGLDELDKEDLICSSCRAKIGDLEIEGLHNQCNEQEGEGTQSNRHNLI